MEDANKETGLQGYSQKKWSETSTVDAREERSTFNPPQPASSLLQQQNPALCPQLPAMSLQTSSALPQMPIYPSRFYYQCYAPPPYGRPVYDPCAAYPAFYQSEEYRPKEKRRRSRTVFTQEQILLLEEGFQDQKYPDSKFRQEMASKTALPEDRVQVWFQNRRAKEKRLMEEKIFRESQSENETSEEQGSRVQENRGFLETSYQSHEEAGMRQLELVTTSSEVEESGLGNNLTGEITKQDLPPATQLTDIGISSYLAPSPLPRPSASHVGQIDPANHEGRNANNVLVSLDQPTTSSSLQVLDGLPRHLFSNTEVSAYCESTAQEDSKLGSGHFQSSSFEVFLPEPVCRKRDSHVTEDSARAEVEMNHGNNVTKRKPGNYAKHAKQYE